MIHGPTLRMRHMLHVVPFADKLQVHMQFPFRQQLSFVLAFGPIHRLVAHMKMILEFKFEFDSDYEWVLRFYGQ